MHFIDRFKKDTISYYQNDSKTDDSEKLYEELYPDAFNIVQKKIQSENLSKVLRPTPEKDDNYEIYVNQLFYELTQQEIGRSQESLVVFGHDVKKDEYIEELSIDLCSYKKNDLADARRLEHFVVDQLVKKLMKKKI